MLTISGVYFDATVLLLKGLNGAPLGISSQLTEGVIHPGDSLPKRALNDGRPLNTGYKGVGGGVLHRIRRDGQITLATPLECPQRSEEEPKDKNTSSHWNRS